ncbi:MAG: twin-arginine translocase TatA/TatE family subunit [Kiritimatiellae bacterium]|nr:twin-arginine translocase TatA/TatE family subunit [Kiritimatiellia bacterium]
MGWGPWQMLLLVLVLVLLFGSKKLPELARSLGKAKKEFAKGLKDDEESENASKKDE